MVKGELVSAQQRYSDTQADFNTALGIPLDRHIVQPERQLSCVTDLDPINQALWMHLENGTLLDMDVNRSSVDLTRLELNLAHSDLLPLDGLFLSGGTE